jgi:hypothetical protein
MHSILHHVMIVNRFSDQFLQSENFAKGLTVACEQCTIVTIIC